MIENLVFSIGILLSSFVLATFILSRIPSHIFPEEYEFKLDPFWYMIGLLLIFSGIVYYTAPSFPDTIKDYSVWDFVLPIIFSVIIYFFYLLGISWLTPIIIYLLALVICFLQPDTFNLFPEHLSPLQDTFVEALFITLIAIGLGLLNGLPAIASMQFNTIMLVCIVLTYLGILPQILGFMALTYFGVMLAFSFLSWPPEKIMMTNEGFISLGFTLACFMLQASVEFSEASMAIAAAFLFTELGYAFYHRFILMQKREYLFMNTTCFKLYELGADEKVICISILKIFLLNILLAFIQTVSYERIALTVFAIGLNFWYLSILSGDTQPEELLSISKWGRKVIKASFAKKTSSPTNVEPQNDVEPQKKTSKKSRKKQRADE